MTTRIIAPAGQPEVVELAPDAFLPMLDLLGATAAQRAEIARIIERRRPQTEAILERSLPVLRSITDSTDNEIRAVLTPAQRRRLDSLRLDPNGPPVLVLPGQVAPAPTPGGTDRALPLLPPSGPRDTTAPRDAAPPRDTAAASPPSAPAERGQGYPRAPARAGRGFRFHVA